MINKKGFLLRDVVITGVLFTGIMALFVLMIGSISNNYNAPDLVSQEFSDNYDKLTNITSGIEISRGELSANQGFSLIGSFDIAWNSIFTVVSLVFSTLALYGTMASTMISQFTFIPASVIFIFMQIALSIFTAYIVFTWMSSVLRGKI
jgi:hypothetical protein